MCQPCNVYLGSANCFTFSTVSNAVLNRSFLNHQKLMLSFSQDPSGRLIGRVNHGEFSSEGLKVLLARNQAIFNLDSSKEMTFYPKQSAIVIGTYGLRGGMKPNSSSSSSSSSMSGGQVKVETDRVLMTRGGNCQLALSKSIAKKKDLLYTKELVKASCPKLSKLTEHSDEKIRNGALETIDVVAKTHGEIKSWLTKADWLCTKMNRLIEDISNFNETVNSYNTEIQIIDRNKLEQVVRAIVYFQRNEIAKIKQDISDLQKDFKARMDELSTLNHEIVCADINVVDNGRRLHEERAGNVSNEIFWDRVKQIGEGTGSGICSVAAVGSAGGAAGVAVGSFSLPATIAVGTLTVPVSVPVVIGGGILLALLTGTGAYGFGCAASNAKERIRENQDIKEGLDELVEQMEKVRGDHLNKMFEFKEAHEAFNHVSRIFECGSGSLDVISESKEELDTSVVFSKWRVFCGNWGNFHTNIEFYRAAVKSVDQSVLGEKKSLEKSEEA